MRKQQVVADGAVQQCKDEASIQFFVGNHPYIVTPHHAFQNNDNVYLGRCAAWCYLYEKNLEGQGTSTV